MRPLTALALGLSLLASTPLRAESFPFNAYVRADGTPARMGPGETFAASDRLDRGTEVSVYRRDPGGWLAIRPPDGSFDWVDGRWIKLDDEGRTGAATKSEVPVLVGSRLGGFKTDGEWQVKLDRGEAVEILGKKQVGEELWYKVAPPAGEFRWVREQEISAKPPAPGEEPPPVEMADAKPKQATLVEGPGVTRLVSDETPVKPETKPAAAPLLLTPISSNPAAPAEGTTTAAAPAAAPPSDGFVPRPKNGEPRVASLPQSNPVTLPTTNSLPSGGIPAGNAPPRTGVRPGSDEEVLRELADLDIDLALVVAQDPKFWQLDTLRARAEACNDAAAAPQLRARAREMVQKIGEFDTLRQRAGQLAALETSSPAKTPPPLPAALGVPAASEAAKAATADKEPEKSSPAASTAGDTAATSTTPEQPSVAQEKPQPEFDGEGWLMPVITRRKDVPPFALTDDNGKLVGFVTPMPGVNLERYKKQKIGIKGQRGFIDEFNQPHVTAERVKVIENAPKLR